MDALGQMAFGRAMQLGRDNRALADDYNQANANVAIANAEIEKGNQTIRALKARVAELELALAVEKAHAEGLMAQLKKTLDIHPTSPMLADSGKRYKSGNIKTKGRLIYEAEFDRIFAGARISGRLATEFRAD